MKNLAGNDCSIFLFRFVLRKNAISYVLNESIAEDMYPEIEEQIQPLVQACSERSCGIGNSVAMMPLWTVIY